MPATVMLIDDSDTVRADIRAALDEAGFEVIEARDQAEAALRLRDVQVDLIVCDVNVPSLCEKVSLGGHARLARRAPPLLLVSEEGEADLVHAAKACGAKGWMAKPLKPALLVAAARRLTRP